MEAQATTPQAAPGHGSDAPAPATGSGVAIAGRENAHLGLKVSPAAVVYAKKRLAERGTPNAAIRLGVRGGGCSGFSYVIEFSDDPPRDRDSVGSSDGVTFYVDKKSLVFLNGSTLDYTKTLMFQGFQFLNPQEASKCGCGHSFTVK
jgi:iron-sulfur cluster assembly protein